MYSVGTVGGVGDRRRGVSGKVMEVVWWGKGSDWGGTGGVLVVISVGRGYGWAS